VLLLIMAVIQFSGAWILPTSGFGGVDTMINSKPFGVPFQMMLWLMIAFGICLHVAHSGFDFMARVLAPWYPYLLVALLASVVGIAPITSLRIVILWALCVMSALIVVGELPAEQSRKLLYRMTAALVVCSLLWAVITPGNGGQSSGSPGLWRGVFSNKNQLGWIATLSLLVILGEVSRVRWKMPAFLMLIAVICIFKSGSKGALVAAVVTVGYMGLLAFLRTRVTAALGISVVLGTLLSAVVFGFLVLPALLALLGKDPTFTGRTFVWSMYFNSMVNTPFLGEGPGSYTYLSELTSPLAMRLSDLGAIVTPHNAFLGAFGDGGVFGFLAFTAVLVYLGIIAPFLKHDRATLICAGVAFFNMAHGMVETHEVFGGGFAWFLMIFLRGLSERERLQQLVQKVTLTKEGAQHRPINGNPA
jgi:O-antigen ligase